MWFSVCRASGHRAYLAYRGFKVMFRELPESSGSECLGSMTPETQDIYLRMDHHRRRSGYRLGRIIARQQLLKKISGGRRAAWIEGTVQIGVGNESVWKSAFKKKQLWL